MRPLSPATRRPSLALVPVHLAAAVLLAAVSPAFGQIVSEPNLGRGASRGTVAAVRVSTAAVPSWPDPPPATTSTHPKTYPTLFTGTSTSPLIVVDPATGTQLAGPIAAAVPAIGASWPGIGPNNGSPPPDPTLAVGMNHVLLAVNDDFAIFTKAGVKLAQIDFNTWFESNDRFFDPKCAYDHLAQRYLCVVLRTREAEKKSWWSLMASDDNDPTGVWHTYHFDATLDSETPTEFWADYPYLGYDPSAIYLTGNMSTWDRVVQYAKLRILDKWKVYNGLPTGWWDFWNLQSGAASCSGDGQRDRSLAPAQTMDSGAPAEYVLSTKGCGGNQLTLRRITQPLNWVAGPTMTTELVGVGAYALPPLNIQQPKVDGKEVSLNQMANYLGDKVILRGGFLHAAHTAGFQWSGDPGLRAVLRLYVLRPQSVPTVVDRQSQFGHPGRDYYYPSTAPTSTQDMVVGFARSSDVNGEFPGQRYTVWPSGGALLGSRNVKMGTGSYTNKSWGDYFGVQPDPADPDNVWFVGEYSLGGNNWGNWVAEIQVP